ncbi:glycoside hydrolase family 9 protein [Saccharothrix australiensis]|uniref:Cellulase-like Ig domain-containing protein n=1 Tax=Saccharothrix australiensis TaxID=2072 RepID=A0A495W629_9PSEU|nr:glycoside hydrolase family 9 protein [Saccharothrix australiensis]RKT57171.1 cellulase-like Ig domain-containing protein [Saccharothrix australiensis]
MRFPRWALASVLALIGSVTAVPAQAAPVGQVRVDQVGYGAGESKQAYLMTPSAVSGRFSVVDAKGRTAWSGRLGASLGGWSARYGAVQPIDFSGLTEAGTYRVRAAGVTSPPFRVGGDLFDPVADRTVEFFQAQRDGRDVVPGRLGRKPAHLTDRAATVYATPVFRGDGGDQLAEPLRPTGRTVDVEGGWFDAGDFVKFTHASAYATASLLFAQRDRSNPALSAETRFGLRWLDKVWDADRGVLYAQVGIGTGSTEHGFLGDHDVWRLPEDDDRLDVRPGDAKYFIKHRPVFAANEPGERISPNLVGRVTASFALAAQVEARRDPKRARALLEQAASLFARAKTADVGELVTAFPHAYYPEDSWADDLEFGATQLALAGKALRDPRAAGWARAATHWASVYLASGDTDTLNVYNTSALGHRDLVRLLRAGVPGAEVTEAQLVGDLRRQLQSGVDSAARSPFRTAADVAAFDAATRSFGFAATARLYREVTGDRSFDAFGVQQRNFALGANAWGTTLVVGVGSRFPECPHHQAANLSGDPDGGHRVLVGAVINGPNAAALFDGLGEMPEGAIPCAKPYPTQFDSATSRFVDELRSWPSSEPAIDFTATAALAFSLS